MKTLKTFSTCCLIVLLPIVVWSQNVGIGTTTPSSKLTVVDTVRNTINIQTLDNAKSTGISFQNSGGSYSWNIFRKENGTNNSDLIIGGGELKNDINDLTERFKITKDGNTEIYGTTTMDSSLIVNGNLTTMNGNTVFNQDGEPTNFRVESDSSQFMFFIKGSQDRIGIKTSNPMKTLDVNGDTRVTGNFNTRQGNSVFNESGDSLIFRVESDTSQAMLFVNGANNRVGLNTGNPQFGFDVNTTVGIREDFTFNPLNQAVDFRIKTLNRDALFFVNGSKDFIGIRTTTPSAELDIVGNLEVNGISNLNGPGKLNFGLTTIGGGSIFNENGEDLNFRIESLNSQVMFFVDADEDKIGIGTATPSAKLDVVGNLEVNGISNLNGPTKMNFGLTTIGANSVFNEDGEDRNFRIESLNSSVMFFVDADEDKIGVGTNTPSAELDVVGDTELNGTLSTKGFSVFNQDNEDYNFRIKSTGNDNMFLVDASANQIGIGTNTPSAQLDLTGSLEVNGNTELNGSLVTTSNSIFNQDGENFNFRVEGLSKDNLFFVDASEDRIGINTNTPSARLDVEGSTELNGNLEIIHGVISDSWPITFSNSTQSNFLGGLRVNNSGFVEMTNIADVSNPARARLNNNGVWTVASDRRLKTNIVKANDLLTKALQLDPVNYELKNDKDKITQLGFIAQEVQQIFPEFVVDGDFLTLNYSGLSVVAIGAIKELKKENDILENRIAELEAANDRLATQASDINNLKDQIKREILAEINQDKRAEIDSHSRD